MGRDKAMIPVAGRTLLERAVGTVREAGGAPLILGGARDDAFGLRGVRVEDEAAAGGARVGPLNALRHGLRVGGTRVVVALACDLPLVPPDLLRFLAGECEREAAIVPRAAGELQVLAAAYAVSCLDVIERRLEAGQRSVHGLLTEIGARVIEGEALLRFGGEGIFLNVNSPEDLARVESILRGRTA
jgi:molybdopterin-guanine dinucleotide biosynthesis protein A